MKKTSFPRKYTERGLAKKYDRAIKYYNNGLIVEAFALLYAITETQLQAAFKFVIHDYCSIKIYEKIDFVYDWEYSHLIRILSEIRIISKSELGDFKRFQAGRNKAIHQLPMLGTHEKLDMHTIDSSFHSGKKAYLVAQSLVQKMFSEELRKVDLNNRTEQLKLSERYESAFISARKKRLI
jgi:hypothetical protein